MKNPDKESRRGKNGTNHQEGKNEIKGPLDQPVTGVFQRRRRRSQDIKTPHPLHRKVAAVVPGIIDGKPAVVAQTVALPHQVDDNLLAYRMGRHNEKINGLPDNLFEKVGFLIGTIGENNPLQIHHSGAEIEVGNDGVAPFFGAKNRGANFPIPQEAGAKFGRPDDCEAILKVKKEACQDHESGQKKPGEIEILREHLQDHDGPEDPESLAQGERFCVPADPPWSRPQGLRPRNGLEDHRDDNDEGILGVGLDRRISFIPQTKVSQKPKPETDRHQENLGSC